MLVLIRTKAIAVLLILVLLLYYYSNLVYGMNALELVKLELRVDSNFLFKGTKANASTYAYYKNGAVIRVDAEVEYSIDHDVIDMNQAGIIVAKEEGKAKITAEYQGMKADTVIEVKDAEKKVLQKVEYNISLSWERRKGVIQLTWSNAPGIESFTVYRKQQGSRDYRVLVEKIMSQEFTDLNINDKIGYNYKIKFYDTNGREYELSEVTVPKPVIKQVKKKVAAKKSPVLNSGKQNMTLFMEELQKLLEQIKNQTPTPSQAAESNKGFAYMVGLPFYLTESEIAQNDNQFSFNYLLGRLSYVKEESLVLCYIAENQKAKIYADFKLDQGQKVIQAKIMEAGKYVILDRSMVEEVVPIVSASPANSQTPDATSTPESTPDVTPSSSVDTTGTDVTTTSPSITPAGASENTDTNSNIHIITNSPTDNITSVVTNSGILSSTPTSTPEVTSTPVLNGDSGNSPVEPPKDPTEKQRLEDVNKAVTVAIEGLFGKSGILLGDDVEKQYKKLVPEGTGVWVLPKDRATIENLINTMTSKRYFVDVDGFLKEAPGGALDSAKSAIYSAIIDSLISGNRKMILGSDNGWNSFDAKTNTIERKLFTWENQAINMGANFTDQVVILSSQESNTNVPKQPNPLVPDKGFILFHQLAFGLKGFEGKKKSIEKDEEEVSDLEEQVKQQIKDSGYNQNQEPEYNELQDQADKALQDQEKSELLGIDKRDNNQPQGGRNLLAMSVAYSIQSVTETRVTAELVASSATVYGGPGLSYATTGTVALSTGDRVLTVLTFENDWYCIEYSTSKGPKRGYVYKDKLSQTGNNGYITRPLQELVEKPQLDGYTDTLNKAYLILTGPGAYAPAKETLASGTHMTVFDRNVNNYVLVEYSTPDKTKRGYVPTSCLSGYSEGVTTTIGVATGAKVYAGPGLFSAPNGSIDLNEYVVALKYENDMFWVEYNTPGGRKRGYIAKETINNYSDIYNSVNKINYVGVGYSDAVSGLTTAYTGPDSKFATVGTIGDKGLERLTVLKRINNDYSLVEFSTPSKTKRGYILNNMLVGYKEGKTSMAKTGILVYSGPGTFCAQKGTADMNEIVVALEYENDMFYVEYNTPDGRKRGYVGKNSIVDNDGSIYNYVRKPVWNSGYSDTATVELQTYTGPALTFATAGKIFATERMTVLENLSSGFSLVEYSTPDKTKRGYVETKYLAEHRMGTTAVMEASANVYCGPDTKYYDVGGLDPNEIIVAIEVDDSNWFYVEYNTPKGRKRGYVPRGTVVNDQVIASKIVNTDYDQTHYGVANKAEVSVYSGASDQFAYLGKVFLGERVTVFEKTEDNYLYIEYDTQDTQGGQTAGTKRGYVLATDIDQKYTYSIPSIATPVGVEKVHYGWSGTGNNELFAYRISNSSIDTSKVAMLVCEQHGFEDAWNRDGEELVKIGNYIVEQLAKNKTKLNGWTIYVVPSANPDGLAYGYTNIGIGRCTSEGVDLNRSYDVGYDRDPNPSDSKRYYNGIYPGTTPEASALKKFIFERKASNGTTVLYDLHGWLEESIGNSQVAEFYQNAFGITKHIGFKSAYGYLVSWADAQGINSALLELPMPTSPADIIAKQFKEKMYNTMINLVSSNLGAGNTKSQIIYGTISDDVAILQTFLKQNGYYSYGVDGKYYGLTQEAVTLWQKNYNISNDHDIVVDGIVGKETWSAMGFSTDTNGQVIKDAVYDLYWRKAIAEGYLLYKGYVDPIIYILSKISCAQIEVNNGKLWFYGVELDIIGLEIVDNLAYAKPIEIEKKLYSNASDLVDSKLVRIYREEKDIYKYLVFDMDYVNPTNIDPVLARRLAAFARDRGIKIRISTAFRTREEQQKLYDKDPDNAAVPGTSWHEYGEAIDLKYDPDDETCKKLKNMYSNSSTDNQIDLLEYGIFKPYTEPNKEENKDKNEFYKKNEDWHIQPIETRYDLNKSSYYTAYT